MRKIDIPPTPVQSPPAAVSCAEKFVRVLVANEVSKPAEAELPPLSPAQKRRPVGPIRQARRSTSAATR
jgi:hypothetical protein